MIKYITISIALFFVGCSEVHFDNSMPGQNVAIKHFSSNLIGKYSFKDSLFKIKNEIYHNVKYLNKLPTDEDSINLISANVYITEKKMFYTVIVKYYYNMNKTDTSKLILKHKGESRFFENNYLVFVESSSDTLICLNKKDKLKFHNGKYYLNHFIEEHNWEIYQLKIVNDNQLSINLMNKEDERILKTNLIKRHELMGNIVHLSDGQFNDFIEKGGFRTRFRFRKEVDEK